MPPGRGRPAIRMLLLGAALCGLAAPPVPAAAPDPPGLPQPLSPDLATRIQGIFALRARGRPAAAAEAAERLEDTTLLGHLLADCYLARGGKPGRAELEAWLERFPDYPDAPAIYDRLLPLWPRGTPPPPAPAGAALGREAELALPPSGPEPDTAARLLRNPALDREIARRAEAGAGSALSFLARARIADPAYAATLKAEIAQSLFLRGDDAGALALAATAAAEAPPAALAAPGLVAGLAAWRLGRLEEAAGHFEAASQGARAPGAERAQAAFWAARARFRLGDPDGHLFWMRLAAERPLTLYGMLARKVLGMESGFAAPAPARAWRRREKVPEEAVAAVDATPQGHRALALLQVRQPARAEAELRLLWPATDGLAALRHAVVQVARAAELPALAAQMAALETTAPREDLRYPVPRLTPLGGFTVDPALVYGLIRLESAFDTQAISSAGARGLMQLMPPTAVEVAGAPFPGAGEELADPATNMRLGQRYLLDLARRPPVEGDLMRLLASYYSGPNAVAKWADGIRDGGDPLLFLESIPAADVRDYVRRGLTYSWIYAARFRLPPPGLEELAAGNRPRLHPLPAAQDFLPTHLRY